MQTIKTYIDKHIHTYIHTDTQTHNVMRSLFRNFRQRDDFVFIPVSFVSLESFEAKNKRMNLKKYI